MCFRVTFRNQQVLSLHNHSGCILLRRDRSAFIIVDYIHPQKLRAAHGASAHWQTVTTCVLIPLYPYTLYIPLIPCGLGHQVTHRYYKYWLQLRKLHKHLTTVSPWNPDQSSPPIQCLRVHLQGGRTSTTCNPGKNNLMCRFTNVMDIGTKT